MGYQTVFKRYEMKYLISEEEACALLAAMGNSMIPDRYPRATVRNVYYDTEDFRLIRASIERPIFKEKLRLRSYAQLGARDCAFIELKRKYRHEVYKRRLPLPLCEAEGWLAHTKSPPAPTQIAEEIAYLLSFYQPLLPRVFLSYEREAYLLAGTDVRITLDRNILARTDGLSLSLPPGGTPLLPEGQVLMELKCGGGLPLPLVSHLSQGGIYKSRFSKYGEAYKRIIFETLHRK